MLRELGNLRTEYSSDSDDIATEFYDPCLRNSSRYDRITGFFSSTVFHLIHSALAEFVIENDGHLRFICSPRLSQQDADGLLYGYEAKTSAELADTLRIELREMLASTQVEESARLLAALVASGRLEVRLALVAADTESRNKRMFHDKVGLFADARDDSVGFRGSANETFLGVSPHGNIESIDVWPSWEDGRDAERVENAALRFDDLWNGRSEGVRVLALPEEFRQELDIVARDVDLEQALREFRQRPASPLPPRYLVGDIDLRAHQIDAIERWTTNDHLGILAHATGSGKTITGLYAASLALSAGYVPIVLVPSQLLLEQWATQVKNLLGARAVLVGGGHPSWRATGSVRAAIEASESSASYVIVAVLNSASTEAFRRQVGALVAKTMIIADEVHRVGSPMFSQLLEWLCSPWRLGLSATPERANDPVGTTRIFDYFGGIVHRYTLKNALDDGVLTPYRYEPYWVELQDHEAEHWEELTAEIRRLYAIARAPGASDHAFERLRMKLIERSRIAKSAANKVPIAVDLVIDRYRVGTGQKWLIYCDGQSQLTQVRDALSNRGVSSWEYHSQMAGDPRATLELFDMNGGIVVAIKCLDEGVDIPSATHALVLASSRNPREFIQRRGRILRRSPAKSIADLIDVLVLPETLSLTDPTWSLAVGELARARQFADWALTPESVSKIEDKWISMGLSLDQFDALQTSGTEGDDDE